MSKTSATIFLATLALASPTARACHVVRPFPNDTARFESIFVGEVTGIRLRGYENRQLGRPDACDVAEKGEEPMCFNITSDPLILIFALPRKVVRGEVKDVQELDQAGCNRENISMKEQGIFFVNPGGNSAAIVWESDPDFSDWLERLGVAADER